MSEWWGISISLASAVVAMCALGVTFWQARIMRTHNKLSVRPLITSFMNQDVKGETGYISFDIENCGTGPAIIKNFILLYDGKEVVKNNINAYNRFLAEKIKSFAGTNIGCLVPEYPLASGRSFTLLSFHYDVQRHDVSFADNLNVIIEYQSIYEDEIRTYDSRKDRQFHSGEASNA